jgi:hypothetical protein
MAEREGFEPPKQLPVYTLSRRAPSTTRPSLLLKRSFNLLAIPFYSISGTFIVSQGIPLFFSDRRPDMSCLTGMRILSPPR